MCGIAATLGYLKYKGISESLIRRGPDDQGIYQNDHVQLIQTRLQITGKDKLELPMRKNGTFILFNGEIYNHKDLRKRLKYPFEYDSDYEIVLAAYFQWGAEFVDYIQGQYCIVVYHYKKLEIFRDRLGIRTCYIGKLNNSWALASDIKTLAKVIPVNINDINLEMSKVYGYGNITKFKESNEYEILQIP